MIYCDTMLDCRNYIDCLYCPYIYLGVSGTKTAAKASTIAATVCTDNDIRQPQSYVGRKLTISVLITLPNWRERDIYIH